MIIAFVGKGGVGKTTVASSTALALAGRGRTVIVSSDFMPSLRFVFPAQERNLEVIELSEKVVSQRWKDTYGPEVATILKQLFDVSDWVLDHISESPGVAEEFMISNIVDLELSGKYDYVVWDTAASSSTMHLILLQKEFYEHLSRDVRLYLKLRDTIHTDKILDLLEEWKILAQKVWSQILNTKFFLVTTQDDLSLIQTKEISRDLESMGIKIRGKICNRYKKDSHGDFILTIPELNGSAREVVNMIYDSITSDEGKMSLFAARNAGGT